MKIYFAGSIRGGRANKELYAWIIELLEKYGTVLTEHVGDVTLSEYGEHEITEQEIYERDIEMLEQADVVVAEVTNPSLGVGYEIAWAEAHGKKILCLYREQKGKRLSAMIEGNTKTPVVRYTHTEELSEILADFFTYANKQ